jgi:S-adenosylmethionine decarboxylase
VNNGTPALGRHLLADFHGVRAELLTDAGTLELLLCDAAGAAGAHVLSAHLHRFGGGGGVTGVVLLRESHISIHTWPEFGYAALDIFMCGRAHVQRAVEVMRAALGAPRVTMHEVARGIGPRGANGAWAEDDMGTLRL